MAEQPARPGPEENAFLWLADRVSDAVKAHAQAVLLDLVSDMRVGLGSMEGPRIDVWFESELDSDLELSRPLRDLLAEQIDYLIPPDEDGSDRLRELREVLVEAVAKIDKALAPP